MAKLTISPESPPPLPFGCQISSILNIMPENDMPDHRADPRGPSFLSRFRDTASHPEKEALARLVSSTAFDPGQPIFVASGTTTFIIAKHLLSEIRGAQIWMNSAPLLYAFLEMQDSDQLAPHVQLGVVRGEVNPTTGIVSSSPLGKLPTHTLLYAPHGLSSRGIVGRRDIRDIKAIISAHRDIVMPLTWDKIFREAPNVIKHLGHAEKEIQQGKRSYHILLPPIEPELTAVHGPIREKLTFLESLQTAGFRVTFGSR